MKHGVMFYQRRWPNVREVTTNQPIATLLPTLCQLYFHLPLHLLLL